MNGTSSDPASIEASTVTEVLAAYAAGGFTGEFSAVEGARLECYTCNSTVGADEVVMSSLRRLEGASDPADMVAVVALTCPLCGARGATVLAFGAAASAEDSDALGALRDHRHDTDAPGNSAPGETAGDDVAGA